MPITDEQIDEWTRQLRENEHDLRQIDATESSLTDDQLKRIAHGGLSKNVILTKLMLAKNRLTSESMERLATNIPPTHIILLDLSCNRIGLAGIEALATNLAKLGTLETLNLSQTLEPDNGILGAKALEPFKQSRLTDLNISSNSLFGEGCVEIVNTFFVESRTNRLKVLDISDNSIGVGGDDPQYIGVCEGVRQLHRVLSRKKCPLRVLNVAKNRIFQTAALMMAEAVERSQLIKFDMSGNFIGSKGAAAMASATSKSQTLKELVLGNFPVDVSMFKNMDDGTNEGALKIPGIIVELGLSIKPEQVNEYETTVIEYLVEMGWAFKKGVSMKPRDIFRRQGKSVLRLGAPEARQHAPLFASQASTTFMLCAPDGNNKLSYTAVPRFRPSMAPHGKQTIFKDYAALKNARLPERGLLTAVSKMRIDHQQMLSVASQRSAFDQKWDSHLEGRR
jgi:Ran GTPase-activating protein (RanGAP) involved in mRNA processing and transport